MIWDRQQIIELHRIADLVNLFLFNSYICPLNPSIPLIDFDELRRRPY